MVQWTASTIKFVFYLIFILIASTLTAFAQDNSTHVVQSGENLYRIALRYGIDMNDLASANNITDMTRVYSGQTLVIPGLEAVDSSTTISNPLVAAAPVNHTIQRGEILSQIAAQYGVTVEEIIRANNIANPNRIEYGEVLQIWTTDISTTETAISDAVIVTNDNTNTTATNTEVANAPAVVVSTSSHIVQRGEYLSQIAKAYGVSWTSIAELNGITDPNRVFAGMELQIPVAGATASGATNNELGIITDPGNSVVARWGEGREILVDLSTQMVYAFEDGILQHSALSSTGLPATPTVQGDYSIWHKTPSQTMSGPGYYLPNVEWVMYFYQGYGLHGTYWHNNFGQPMSHGCVNLTNSDALWFYNFASLGTPVHVRW